MKNIAGADCSCIRNKVIPVRVVQDAHTFQIFEQKHIAQPVKMAANTVVKIEMRLEKKTHMP
nr:hypothetical protein [uncultured Methanomethylovorans sp.]